LTRRGIDVTAGEVPEGALIVGSASDADAHLVVHARPDDTADDVDAWAGLISTERQS
jgi:hypothetical protein